MKIGKVSNQVRLPFGFGSSRSARRSIRGPAFGPGAAIRVRRADMVGRPIRARAARRVKIREKTIAEGFGVEWGEVGKIASCGRKDVGKQDKHRTSQHTPDNQLLFDLSTHFTMAVRLRKVFRYPEELDEREELDEEEQERVIEQLQSQNDARNAQYSVHIIPIQSSFHC